MKQTLKLFIGTLLVFSAISPLSAGAQGGGMGCTRLIPGPNPRLEPVCSTTYDCSDVQAQCDSPLVCASIPACPATPPPPPPPPPPSSQPDPATPAYTPPQTLPIKTGLPLINPVPVSGPQGQGPAAIIANFYSMAFLVAGFLAFVMITYGGVRYAFSAGNHSYKEEGKEAVRQSFFGLGLLLVAYLILRTINPDLTTLEMPELTPYVPPAVPPASTSTTPGGCSGSCSCQQYLASHGSSFTSCTPSPAVNEMVQCIAGRVPGASPSATTDGNHSGNSCHFGGRSCVGIGHAIDYGIIGVGGPARLTQVKAAAEQCGAMTGNQVECFYETPQGKRDTTWTATSPGVNHIHCNVNNLRDSCGCE